MIEDDDDMDWDKTNVLVHLRRKFKVRRLPLSVQMAIIILIFILG